MPLAASCSVPAPTPGARETATTNKLPFCCLLQKSIRMQFEQGMILISAASNIVPGKLWGQRVGVGQSHTGSLCSCGTGLNGWENNVAVSRLGHSLFASAGSPGKEKYLHNVKGISPEGKRKPVSQPLTRAWETGWAQDLFLSGPGTQKA